MKFYDCASAPSPRRVRIFLAEKGITVPTVQVDLRAGEQFGPAFRAINPDCTVPVLELDDGVKLTDAVAICGYFEERQPEPALMGAGAEERAVVTEWQRRAERDGFYAVMDAFRNSTPGFKGRAIAGPQDYEQIPALAERDARPALFRNDRCAARRPRIRRRAALHHRRHHHPRDGGFREMGEVGGSGELYPSAPLARDSGGAPQRQRVKAVLQSDESRQRLRRLTRRRQCRRRSRRPAG